VLAVNVDMDMNVGPTMRTNIKTCAPGNTLAVQDPT